MLKAIADAIEAKLIALGCFKSVQFTFLDRTSTAAPSALLYLLEDKGADDYPDDSTRDLTWCVRIVGELLGNKDKAAEILNCIDLIRSGFSGWVAKDAGCHPAIVRNINYKIFEDGVAEYQAIINMRVIPAIT